MVQIYHFNNTMRRMNSRSPPFAIVGLVLVCLFISYNYWTLFSQNEDLKKDIEKLQAEIKIEGVKLDQFDKKNQILQSNVHDLSEKSEKLQLNLRKEDDIIKDFEDNVQHKNVEISDLKNNINKKNDFAREIHQQIDDKDEKIEDLIRESQHILTLKNEAEEALADKDSLINTLKMEQEQVKAELILLKIKITERENLDLKPKVTAGFFNLPKINQKKEYKDHGSLSYAPKSGIDTKDKGLSGLQYQEGAQILPREPSNVPRAVPSVSVAKLGKMLEESLNQIQEPLIKSKGNIPDVNEHKLPSELDSIVLQNPPLDKNDIHDDPVDVVDQPHLMDDKNVETLQKGLGGKLENIIAAPKEADFPMYHEHQQNVLAPPQKHDDNPDTAIDDEENELVDPLDDQDEEGKEIKKDLNNDDNYEYDVDQRHPPPFGESADRKPMPFGGSINGHHDEETAQRDMFHVIDDNNNKANERVFEANLDKKIRNLGVRHL